MVCYEANFSPHGNFHPSTIRGNSHFLSAQKPDRWLASKFRAADAIGSGERKIGNAADILLDKDGKFPITGAGLTA